jgi:hypothetical protein
VGLPLDLSLDGPDPAPAAPSPTRRRGGFGFVELGQSMDEAAVPLPREPEPPAMPLPESVAPPARRRPPPRLLAEQDFQDCPACGRNVRREERRCPHCRVRLFGPEGGFTQDGERTGPPWQPQRGGVALTLGVLSLLCSVSCGPTGVVLGILAWAMTQSDLARMRASEMDPDGFTLTQAGRVCAIAGTVVGFLWTLAILFLITLG